MAEFVLPPIKIGRRRYNCLVWRYDNYEDRNGPMRVFLRMHPAVEQWFSDNQVEYSVGFWRVRSQMWDRSWDYRYHVIIQDPAKAILFKLTWM